MQKSKTSIPSVGRLLYFITIIVSPRRTSNESSIVCGFRMNNAMCYSWRAHSMVVCVPQFYMLAPHTNESADDILQRNKIGAIIVGVRGSSDDFIFLVCFFRSTQNAPNSWYSTVRLFQKSFSLRDTLFFLSIYLFQYDIWNKPNGQEKKNGNNKIMVLHRSAVFVWNSRETNRKKNF